MSLVMLLPLLVTLNGLAIPVAGVSLHADQLAALALVFALGAQTLIGARQFRVDSTVWWLGAILVLNVAATLANSPTRGYSLLQCANLASVWVIYLLVINFVDTRERVDALIRRVLWAAIVASVVAILAFVLAVAGLDVGGAEVSSEAATRFTQAYGAYGFMVEPNLLGGFAAAHLVFAVTLLVFEAGDREESTMRLARWTAGVSAVALLLSFTRAAWLSALVGLFFIALFNVRRVLQRARELRVVGPLSVAAGVAVILFMLPGEAGAFFRFKLVNLFNPTSQTGVVRLITYAMALDQTTTHPVLGWGTFTFAPLVAQGADFQQFENWRNLWISNYLLLAVHDTGVIGLVLWLGLMWSIVMRGLRTARATRFDPKLSAMSFGLTGAIVALLFAFLATSGFSLGYPWLLAGLLAAHARVSTAPESADDPLGVADRSVDTAEEPVGGVVPGV